MDTGTRHPWLSSFLAFSLILGLGTIVWGLFFFAASFEKDSGINPLMGLIITIFGAAAVWAIIRTFRVCGAVLSRWGLVPGNERTIGALLMLPGLVVGSVLFVFLFCLYLYFKSGQFSRDSDEFGW